MKRTTLRFELRTDRTSNGTHPIVVKLYADRKNKYIGTIFRIATSDWLSDKERTVDNAHVNSYLDDVSSKFNKFIINQPECIDLDHIAKVLFDERYEEKIKLLTFISLFVTDKKKKNDVIPKTLTRYDRVLSVMKSFLKENKMEGTVLMDVHVELINKWDSYLKTNVRVKEKQLEKNTLNKYHSILRTMLIQAFNEGKIKTNPYNLFKLNGKPTHRQFLTDEELDLLKRSKSTNLRLEKVRLIYLFSCYTGLRFADAQSISPNNIYRNKKGEVFLSFVSSKSSKQQEIPILDDAIAIISEIENTFADEITSTNKLLPRISNQKFNDYMKGLALRVGLEKELTHHTARHSFATYMLNRNVAPHALQVLLGHSNIRETMVYAKITPGYLKKEVEKGNMKI
jgi:integrase/recombinase XerD